jgi:conjugative transfer region protein TrbK
MKPQIIAAVAVVFAAVPVAQAQTVDDLLANHALLGTELDRCKQMGMASTNDARCKTARAAEQKRFFGNGVGYTQRPVDVTPGEPVPPTTNDPPQPKPKSDGQ